MPKTIDSFAKGAWTIFLSRVSTFVAIPFLIALVNIAVSAYKDSKAADLAQLGQIAAVQIQLAQVQTLLEGAVRTQAATDAGQDWRMNRLENEVDRLEERASIGDDILP